MMKKLLLPALLAAVAAMAAAAEITPALRARLAQAKSGERVRCWVCFADKGAPAAPPSLPERALARRRKAGAAPGYGDLPVDPSYLAAVGAAGGTVRYASAWLNAASVEAGPAAVAAIAALPFVSEIDALPAYRTAVDRTAGGAPPGKAVPAPDYGLAQEQIKLMRVDELHRRGYTGSGVRLAFLDSGFDREHESLRRVRIVAERDFQRLVISRIDTVSFSPFATDTVWRPDSITSYERDQDISRVQTWHGTGMLSIAGAYKPGSLVGSAYNADFILGKTEHVHSLIEPDFYREEDWFVAGLEWAADSAGADIISSSLGYRSWSDVGDTLDYHYYQMDGRSARATMAADSAAARGVLVLNAIGNVGDAASRNGRPDTCILVPADGRGVLAVGGVWAATRAWAYPPVGTTGSGPACGPAADTVRTVRFGGSDSVTIRRIKPDIASAWQNWYAYNEPDQATGLYNQVYAGIGTSGATALTAGLCALLLEAHPSWGPQQVIAALKYSGSNRAAAETYLAHPESIDVALGAWPAYNPGFAAIATGHRWYGSTDLYEAFRIGWGVPDGVAALDYTTPEVVLPDQDQLLDPYPNPAKPGAAGVHFPFYLSRDSYEVSLRVYTLDGRLVRRIELGQLLGGQYPAIKADRIKRRTGGNAAAFWDLKDARGEPVPGGMYLALLTTGWSQSSKKVVVLR